MTSLPLAIVIQLAVAHAQTVAPETVAAFAQAESRLNPFAIFDNTDRRSYAPGSAKEAAVLARTLLDRGHSIDTGLMQINSANFARTGLDADTAFDPAQSVRAGAQILVDAYQWCRDRQPTVKPLRCMASVYNTGRPTAGEHNGYVGKVFAAADHLVPAIRQALPEKPTAAEPAAPIVPHACGPPPPAWDGWAVSSYRMCVTRASITKPEHKSNEDDRAEEPGQ
ncbi:type IV secretion system protein VirB1 [Skermanella aerolata]|uniref:lytic transglycosylase domain-containing protein n=1 Tax=Skermanella aerolata TaxID=393310 RepID=UPI003D1A95A9